MADLDYLRIIKWVLIVLLAGFIGQLGKSFAKHLLEKVRSKKKGSVPTFEGTPPTTSTGITEKTKEDKKLAKTLAKQKKKEAKALEKQKKT